MSSENIIINTIDMKKEKRREYMKEYDKGLVFFFSLK